MTVKTFRGELITEITEILSEVCFCDSNGKQSKIKGYPQAIPLYLSATPDEENNLVMPKTEAGDRVFPYFVVRTEAVEFPEDDNLNARVMILFGIYDDDRTMRGYETLTTAMERVIMRFRDNQVMDAYWCDVKMEMAFQDDDSYPYFFGGIDMSWHMPE